FTIQNGKPNNGYEGGGINVGNSYTTPIPASPTIRNCYLINNDGRTSGGGIFVFAGQPVLINCVITRGNAIFGGARSTHNSQTTLINCTVANNASLFDARNNSHLILTNCIFWGNGPSYAGDDARYTAAYTYCDTDFGASGTGNISADPGFLNADANDYR